jgi:hypothetical protein
MALQLKREIKGVECDYWRIIQINQNFNRKDCVITLGLYKDKETREKDETAILFTLKVDLFEEYQLGEYEGKDIIKNINLGKAYKEFIVKAKTDVKLKEFSKAKET